jgi:hypothetical protein
MPFDNDAAKAELVRILGTRRQALLLVGSGSSRFVGYPSWPALVDELRAQVIPEHPFPTGLDLLQRASFVRTTLETFNNRVDRRRLYRDSLEHTFGPHNPNFGPLHRSLIQLPVCGIATTNYDPVLESAITAARVAGGLGVCQAIDVCANHRHRVFRFLRSLSAEGDIESVLHLHGYWEHPDGLILTSENYAERYGLVAAADPAAAGDPLAAPGRPLDTFHRKVVWSLLTTRPVMFVGFSVEDPAFQLMLSFVHEDFDLAPNPAAHFAVLPSDPADAGHRDRDADRLAGFGVRPVFYDITVDGAGTCDTPSASRASNASNPL